MTEPDRAARLTADAERVAQSLSESLHKDWQLAIVAEATAAIDPDRAERIAQSISDKEHRSRAFAAVAGAVAANDPDRAEAIAWSIRWESYMASGLTAVAEAVVAADPDRAVRLIGDAERVAQQSIPNESRRACALAAAAKVIQSDRPGPCRPASQQRRNPRR